MSNTPMGRDYRTIDEQTGCRSRFACRFYIQARSTHLNADKTSLLDGTEFVLQCTFDFDHPHFERFIDSPTE